MLLVLNFILQYSLYYKKKKHIKKKNQTCISQLEWYQKHFNSLHIPNSQPYFCPSQNNKLSSFNYHQKLNRIQNFKKIPVLFFFYNRTKSLSMSIFFIFNQITPNTVVDHLLCWNRNTKIFQEATEILLFFYLKVDDNPFHQVHNLQTGFLSPNKYLLVIVWLEKRI